MVESYQATIEWSGSADLGTVLLVAASSFVAFVGAAAAWPARLAAAAWLAAQQRPAVGPFGLAPFASALGSFAAENSAVAGRLRPAGQWAPAGRWPGLRPGRLPSSPRARCPSGLRSTLRWPTTCSAVEGAGLGWKRRHSRRPRCPRC